MHRLLGLLALFELEQVQRWFEWGGYFILFGSLFACGLGLPLPEDIPLLLGGYFVSQGQMNIVLVGVLAWSGIIGGDCALYWLSRRYGMGVTRLPLIRHHVTEKRIHWVEGKFQRWGIWVVAVCRLFAGVRGAMVIAAGVTRYHFVKFVVADGIAALVSGGMFVWLGYYAGKKLGSVTEMKHNIERYQGRVVAAIIALVVLAVLYIWWRSRRHKTLSEVTLEKVEEAATHIADRDGHTHPAGRPDATAPTAPAAAERSE